MQDNLLQDNPPRWGLGVNKRMQGDGMLYVGHIYSTRVCREHHSVTCAKQVCYYGGVNAQIYSVLRNTLAAQLVGTGDQAGN